MTDSPQDPPQYPPQYPQYQPQYPQFPQGPVAPGPMVRPARPIAMRRALSLMYLGAAAGFVGDVVNGLTTHTITFYASTSPNNTNVHYASSLVAGIIGGIIAAGLWLWMAWKTGAGRNWARVLSSVFFGFMCLQFIGSMLSLAGSGDPFPAFVVVLIEWGAGLAAIILLWRRESSDFFAWAKQAKLAGAFAAQSGYQPPGYQPPGYQPPGYQPPGYQPPGYQPPR